MNVVHASPPTRHFAACVTDRRPHKSTGDLVWPSPTWLAASRSQALLISFFCAGSRKCVLRAAHSIRSFSDQRSEIECWRHIRQTHAVCCTYSRKETIVFIVTVKLWQGAFNILKCFSCAAATSCRPVHLSVCLSQLSAWCDALDCARFEPAPAWQSNSRSAGYQNVACSLPRSVGCHIVTMMHTATQFTYNCGTFAYCAYAQSASRLGHHKFRAHTRKFMSQSSHAPTNAAIRPSVDHQLGPQLMRPTPGWPMVNSSAYRVPLMQPAQHCTAPKK